MSLNTLSNHGKVPILHAILDAGARHFLATCLGLLRRRNRGGAREDWNSFSYFVVQEKGEHSLRYLFVSSDWPSAELYAKRELASVSEA